MVEEEKEGRTIAQTPRRWGLGSRAALLAGFGALLALMGVICVDSLLTMRRFEARNVQIRQDFLNREGAGCSGVSSRLTLFKYIVSRIVSPKAL